MNKYFNTPDSTIPKQDVTTTDVIKEEVKSTPINEDIKHVITEEDLTNNPDLVGQVEVGEEVIIPGDAIVTEEVKEPKTEKTKKEPKKKA
mgnify:CR=1 FL=1